MCENVPTLYQYYTSSGIQSGLIAEGDTFVLNNHDITIYSGALHYFRVPQEYWRDRLRKLRAAGLNTVETYVPWNLHEPEPGVFDFGSGGTDWEHFLDIKKFLNMAKEEDLFAIVRPGPYICAEWDFGGLPSWLLRNKKLKVRTSDSQFMDHVTKYFRVLLKILSVLQFSMGGPIIAFQIENEYGNVKAFNSDLIDKGYLELLKQLLEKNHITELLFTSDTPSIGFSGTIPRVLATANFQNDSTKELELLKKMQSNKPLMVMEYWAGWFDHWTENHHTRSNEEFSDTLKSIIDMESSVNFYMFHGGTNFGFLNGANLIDFNGTNNQGYQPDTSSYDYDAPLNENGDYTDKYHILRKLIALKNKVKTCLPKLPNVIPPVKYDTIDVLKQIEYSEIIKQVPYNIKSPNVVPMELLDINNGAGQSYGYIVYRKENIDIPRNSKLKIEGHVSDTLMVLINGVLVSKPLNHSSDLNDFGYWRQENSTLHFGEQNSYQNATLDLVVENWGRVNFGKLHQFNQFKGLWQGNVVLNGKALSNFNIYPMEFKSKWTNGLSDWKDVNSLKGPSLYMTELNVDAEKVVNDTYIDMRNWNKGIVILNGFVLSRYSKLGPQQTVYVPAPFLKIGRNKFVIFEHFEAGKNVVFSNKQIFETI